ncbi:MAG: YncE family protein [Methanobacteriota archaeon]|nr:MAG: YncE family protein [Euryarchaeota archaeon]
MAERSLPAFVVAGLIVVGSLVAAAVLSSPSGFLGGTRGAENQSTDGLASSTPTPDAWGGSVVGTLPVGNQPYGVGYDSGNGYIYVASSGSNTVHAVFGTVLVGWTTVGYAPYGVAYDSGNGYVYVTNRDSNDVSVINGTTVVTTVPVGSLPLGVAYDSGNGYVYVANSGSNNVSVISGTTVVATIPVGNIPYGVAYDSENGYVYVANSGSNTTSLISTTTPGPTTTASRHELFRRRRDVAGVHGALHGQRGREPHGPVLLGERGRLHGVHGDLGDSHRHDVPDRVGRTFGHAGRRRVVHLPGHGHSERLR